MPSSRWRPGSRRNRRRRRVRAALLRPARVGRLPGAAGVERTDRGLPPRGVLRRRRLGAALARAERPVHGGRAAFDGRGARRGRGAAPRLGRPGRGPGPASPLGGPRRRARACIRRRRRGEPAHAAPVQGSRLQDAAGVARAARRLVGNAGAAAPAQGRSVLAAQRQRRPKPGALAQTRRLGVGSGSSGGGRDVFLAASYARGADGTTSQRLRV